MLGAASVENSVVLDALRESAHRLTGAPADFDPLMERIGDASFVLLGGGSHGTHEFYRARADVTRRLIREKGFTAIAVEADWPDAHRINRYLRATSEDRDSVSALDAFRRFPSWVWRNADILDFIGSLRAHNDDARENAKVGFYGLDLYSLRASMEVVLEYLRDVDPAAAERAARRYGCFDHFGNDTRRYGLLTGLGLADSCEQEVVQQLVELRQSRSLGWGQGAAGSGHLSDERFYVEQNARLVQSAEKYYRTMFRGDASSWNLRDSHMAATLEELMMHLDHDGARTKIVVWGHNSHVGDARATNRADIGEHNLGQLIREHCGADAVLVGFTTYDGTVTAASDWEMTQERMRVRPALAASFEALFHAARLDRSLVLFPPHALVTSLLRQPRLERAMGVVYRPESERTSHYLEARLSDQFDAVVHFDRTRAVEPLERTARWESGPESPDTYPFAL